MNMVSFSFYNLFSDPFRPNDYDAVRIQLKELKRHKQNVASLSQSEDRGVSDEEDDAYQKSKEPKTPPRLAAIASTLLADANGDDAYLRRMQMSVTKTIEPEVQPRIETKHLEDDAHSRVIILMNMVGRGQVDRHLEKETRQQCQKYGQVQECLIVEVGD